MLLSSGAFTYFWRPPPETKAGDVPSTEDSGVEHFGLGRVAGAAVIVARCTSGGGEARSIQSGAGRDCDQVGRVSTVSYCIYIYCYILMLYIKLLFCLVYIYYILMHVCL